MGLASDKKRLKKAIGFPDYLVEIREALSQGVPAIAPHRLTDTEWKDWKRKPPVLERQHRVGNITLNSIIEAHKQYSGERETRQIAPLWTMIPEELEAEAEVEMAVASLSIESAPSKRKTEDSSTPAHLRMDKKARKIYTSLFVGPIDSQIRNDSWS